MHHSGLPACRPSRATYSALRSILVAAAAGAALGANWCPGLLISSGVLGPCAAVAAAVAAAVISLGVRIHVATGCQSVISLGVRGHVLLRCCCAAAIAAVSAVNLARVAIDHALCRISIDSIATSGKGVNGADDAAGVVGAGKGLNGADDAAGVVVALPRTGSHWFGGGTP